jgi:hypothetical protein
MLDGRHDVPDLDGRSAMHRSQQSIPQRLGARTVNPSATSPASAGQVSISAQNLSALAAVLDAHSFDALLDDRSEAFAALHDAVRAVVDDARTTDSLRGERLIVTLRAWWRNQVKLRRRADEGRCEALWSQLLTMCIAGFYAVRERA